MICGNARCQEEADPKIYCPICGDHFCSTAHLTDHNLNYDVAKSEIEELEKRKNAKA